VPLPDFLAALSVPPAPLAALRRVPGLRLVGGWLRDAYYGQVSSDFDLTSELPLEETLDAVAALTGGEPFAVNARFATRRIVLPECTLDISALAPGGVAADIARRDYTVNTLTVALELLGPGLRADDIAGHSQALDDLATRTLRMTSAASLADDPLRVVRAYRFAATAGFSIEPETRTALRQLTPRVMEAAGERLHEELLRWLAGAAAADALALAADDGVLWELLPPLRALPDCIQGEARRMDPHADVPQAPRRAACGPAGRAA
jgi:tRNA nucleotidyltransferase/poly(A) polymerase